MVVKSVSVMLFVNVCIFLELSLSFSEKQNCKSSRQSLSFLYSFAASISGHRGASISSPSVRRPAGRPLSSPGVFPCTSDSRRSSDSMARFLSPMSMPTAPSSDTLAFGTGDEPSSTRMLTHMSPQRSRVTMAFIILDLEENSRFRRNLTFPT